MKYRNQSESELRERVQAGYRYAYSLTQHHHDAEDLVQQAWMSCTNRYGRVKNEAILFTAIRNRFYDQIRRRKIVSFESVDEAPGNFLADPRTPSPGTSDDLETVLAHLRAEEREAIFLHVVEGRTAREIASITGSPRNTVLSLIHRSRKKLADAWKDADETIRGVASQTRTRKDHD